MGRIAVESLLDRQSLASEIIFGFDIIEEIRRRVDCHQHTVALGDVTCIDGELRVVGHIHGLNSPSYIAIPVKDADNKMVDGILRTGLDVNRGDTGTGAN